MFELLDEWFGLQTPNPSDPCEILREKAENRRAYYRIKKFIEGKKNESIEQRDTEGEIHGRAGD